MKWLLSIVFAVLVTLFWADFAPVYKSLAYAQSTPTDASTSADENASEQKASKKIVACDGFGYVWTFKIKKGNITGKVDTGGCGVWDVAGTYNKKTKAITLTATNPTGGDENCCAVFTYTGTFKKKTKIGSGSWTNACGGSGSWSMGPC